MEQKYNTDLKGAKSFSLWLTDFTINLKFYTYILTLSAVVGLVLTVLLVYFKEDLFVKANALTMFFKSVFATKDVYIQPINSYVSATEARKFFEHLILQDKLLLAKILFAYMFNFFIVFVISYKLLAKKVTKHTQEFQKPQFLRGTNVLNAEEFAKLQQKKSIKGIVLTDLEEAEIKKELEETKNV